MSRHHFQLGTLFLVSLLAISASVHAQDTGYPTYAAAAAQPAPLYTQAQIDQLVAPIALYPDPLIGQVLMASTYPLEIVEASRWLQNSTNASLHGDRLAQALQQQPWDPSVKSLTAFPQVLHMMDSNIQWTEQLGDAFLAQQVPVADSVQRLRHQAEATGALSTTSQQVVSSQGPEIIIEPQNPQVIYVPTYNPMVVYGSWPYPGYPPYYFNTPGYAYGTAILGFGSGIIVGETLWGWDRWDWRNHRIDIDNDRFAELNRGRAPIASGVFEHDPDHRHGVPYRDAASRARFQANVTPETRRTFRGFGSTTPPASQFSRVSTPAVAPMARPTAEKTLQKPHTVQTRPEEVQPVVARPQEARPAVHPFSQPARAPVERAPQAQRPATSMFESFSGGSEVRAQSARGSMSRTAAPLAVSMPRTAPMQHAPPQQQRVAPVEQHAAPAHASGGSERDNRDNGEHR